MGFCRTIEKPGRFSGSERILAIMPNTEGLWRNTVLKTLNCGNLNSVPFAIACYRADQAIPSGSVPTARVLVTFREATSTKVSRLAAEFVT